MNTRQTYYRLAAAALVAVAGAAIAIACDSSSSNSTPNPDGGDDATNSSSGASSSGASSSGASSSGASSSGASSSGASSSSSGGDAGPCVPDGGAGASCNSCKTFATDPYNACSPFTTNCIKFDNSVVPDAARL